MKVRILFSMLVLAAAASSHATPAEHLPPQAAVRQPGVPIPIENLVAHALEKNPELAFYKAEIAAAKGERRASGAWSNPELDVDVGHKRARDIGGGLAGEGTAWSVSVAQPLEFPGRIALRKAIANRQVELAELGLEQFRATLASQVRELAYRLYGAQAQAEAAQQAARRGQELVEVIVQRDAAGINPLLESRLIEASVITLASRATEALTEAAALAGELNQLRGEPVDAPLNPASADLEFAELPPADLLVQKAVTNNFDIRAQQLELAAQGLRVDLTKKERWEQITVAPFYSQENAGERENVVGIGLSIPVPLWNRKSGHIEAAEARQKQAEVAVYLAQRRVERELRQRALAYRARLEQMSNWRPEIVQSLRESAELADRHYRLGAVPVATYIELQEKYLEALETILATRAEALQERQRIHLLTGDFSPGTIAEERD